MPNLNKLKIMSLIGVLLLGLSVGAQAKKESTERKPIIDADTLVVAKLDTEINTDHPANTVTATITDGQYKGARLQGTLTETMSRSRQLDRTILYFNTMRLPRGNSVNIAAYAIDVQTVNTAMASDTNPRTLHRRGAKLAAEFLQSYADNDPEDQANPHQPVNHALKKVIVDAGTDVGVIFMANVFNK